MAHFLLTRQRGFAPRGSLPPKAAREGQPQNDHKLPTRVGAQCRRQRRWMLP